MHPKDKLMLLVFAFAAVRDGALAIVLAAAAWLLLHWLAGCPMAGCS
jgi:hypothetical protein